MLSMSWDPTRLSAVEAPLLQTKGSHDPHVLYPNHAKCRGGIGTLVATGVARGGVAGLPGRAHAARALGANRSTPLGSPGRPACASRAAALFATLGHPHTAPTGAVPNSTSAWRSTLSLADNNAVRAAAVAAVALGPGTGLPQEAQTEWTTGVPHQRPFTATTRSTRVEDCPKASKWSGLSFYACDPAQVENHLAWHDTLEARHTALTQEGRDDSALRHAAWGMQQREVFRRQRAELSARYAAAGLPQRRAYSALPSGHGAAVRGARGVDHLTRARLGIDETGGAVAAWGGGAPDLSGAPRVPAVELPRATYTHVAERMMAERAEAHVRGAALMAASVALSAAAKEAREVARQLAEMEAFEDGSLAAAVRRARRRHGATPAVAP
ncbi:hypothetical protein FOA52_002377 [Chlamydomonas sp. UWO 241]|nr:hypothetical protein FOA52_002377 [Chlamydomonas sp. UWO 241]